MDPPYIQQYHHQDPYHMLPPNPPHDPFYSASKSSSSTAHPLHQRSEIFEEERSSASGSGEGSLFSPTSPETATTVSEQHQSNSPTDPPSPEDPFAYISLLPLSLSSRSSLPQNRPSATGRYTSNEDLELLTLIPLVLSSTPPGKVEDVVKYLTYKRPGSGVKIRWGKLVSAKERGEELATGSGSKRRKGSNEEGGGSQNRKVRKEILPDIAIDDDEGNESDELIVVSSGSAMNRSMVPTSHQPFSTATHSYPSQAHSQPLPSRTWTNEEDALLLFHIAVRGDQDWTRVAMELKSGRAGEECKKRWEEGFRDSRFFLPGHWVDKVSWEELLFPRNVVEKSLESTMGQGGGATTATTGGVGMTAQSSQQQGQTHAEAQYERQIARKRKAEREAVAAVQAVQLNETRRLQALAQQAQLQLQAQAQARLSSQPPSTTSLLSHFLNNPPAPSLAYNAPLPPPPHDRSQLIPPSSEGTLVVPRQQQQQKQPQAPNFVPLNSFVAGKTISLPLEAKKSMVKKRSPLGLSSLRVFDDGDDDESEIDLEIKESGGGGGGGGGGQMKEIGRLDSDKEDDGSQASPRPPTPSPPSHMNSPPTKSMKSLPFPYSSSLPLPQTPSTTMFPFPFPFPSFSAPQPDINVRGPTTSSPPQLKFGVAMKRMDEEEKKEEGEGRGGRPRRKASEQAEKKVKKAVEIEEFDDEDEDEDEEEEEMMEPEEVLDKFELSAEKRRKRKYGGMKADEEDWVEEVDGGIDGGETDDEDEGVVQVDERERDMVIEW